VLRCKPAVVAAFALAFFALVPLRNVPVRADPVAMQSSPLPSAPPVPATPLEQAAQTSDPCGGQTRLLATLNRPTVGYSVCAVPQSSIVLEAGYQLTSQFDGKSVAASYPQGFERLGVLDRLEVDVVGPSYNRVHSGNSVSTGYSDLGIGTKYEFRPGGKVAYAIDALFLPPDGDPGFSSGGTTEQLDVDVSYPLTAKVGIATTLAGVSTYGIPTSLVGAGGAIGVSTRAGAPTRYQFFLPSAVLTFATVPSLQFYAEAVGQTRIAPGAGGRLYFDGGVQKLLGTNVEVDAEYGRAVGPIVDGRFQYLGAGLGVRIPQ